MLIYPQKVIRQKNLLFVGNLKSSDEKSSIRIRTTVSWIHNTVGYISATHITPELLRIRLDDKLRQVQQDSFFKRGVLSLRTYYFYAFSVLLTKGL